MSAPDDSRRRGIQSVEIGAEVLTAIERAGGPAALSTIATLADMPASKTHRYLVSLARTGLVSQSDETGLYEFGPVARRLGAEAIRRLDEGRAAGPHAAALRDRTGHTVFLAGWGDAGPTLIRWEYGRDPVHVTVRPGGTLPLWSAVGRVFLAFLPAIVTQPVLERQLGVGLPADFDRAELERDLDEIRRSRFAAVFNTPVLGVDGFAAPVFDAGDRVPLTVGIVAPHGRVKGIGLERVRDELHGATDVISEELGHRDTAGSRRQTRA